MQLISTTRIFCPFLLFLLLLTLLFLLMLLMLVYAMLWPVGCKCLQARWPAASFSFLLPLLAGAPFHCRAKHGREVKACSRGQLMRVAHFTGGKHVQNVAEHKVVINRVPCIWGADAFFLPSVAVSAAMNQSYHLAWRTYLRRRLIQQPACCSQP